MSGSDKLDGRFPLLWLIVIVAFTLILVSAYINIDQSVRAQGVVVSSARTQVVQAADGGTLTAIYVKEGSKVKANEILADLNPSRARAEYLESLADVASNRIALIRANAERTNKAPVYDKADQADWKEFVGAQLGVYNQRKLDLDSEVSTITSSLVLAKNELNLNRRLFESGDLSKTEVMRAERQVLDSKFKLDSLKNKYLQETLQEILKLEGQLLSNTYKLASRKVDLEHTVLRSPMNGVVKLLHVNTVGGVMRAGDELVQISPLDEVQVVQLKVNPIDIGQLTIGLPVRLKFDAYDSSVFGSVDGVLRYISPDTITEKANDGRIESFYRAEVELDFKDSLSQKNRVKPEDVKPGLTATADILTGKRSILYFLAKPIVKAFSGAMTER